MHKQHIMESFEAYLKKFDFQLIAFDSMWEMFVIGFIKTERSTGVSMVNTTRIAKGFGKFIGNKGGCQLNFVLNGYNFNIISCHLVHGAKAHNLRDIMISELTKDMRLHRRDFDPDCLADFSIILGDLNYRLKSCFKELNDSNIQDALEMLKDRE